MVDRKDDECYEYSLRSDDILYKFKPFHNTEIRSENSKPGPVRRSGFQAAVIDSKNLYVYGIFENTERRFQNSWNLGQELWKFNLATRKWTNYKHIINLPYDISYRAVALNNDTLLIYGASGVPEGSIRPNGYSNELYIFHLNSTNNVCAEPVETTGQAPLPQFGQAVVCHGGYLYAVGGATKYTHTCDIHRINLKTLVWEVVYVRDGNGENPPHGRRKHKLACDGERIFMLGGFENGIRMDFRQISIFNIDKKKWTKRNTIGDFAVTYNNGYPPDTDFFDIYQSDTELKLHVRNTFDRNVIIWKIDLEMFQWTRICVLQVPSTSACVMTSAFSPDGKHYMIGYSYSIVATPEIFVTWLEIPKLSKMCWEAVLHYLKVFDEKELIHAGVPLHYVNTIK